jgi:hypothetical protein
MQSYTGVSKMFIGRAAFPVVRAAQHFLPLTRKMPIIDIQFSQYASERAIAAQVTGEISGNNRSTNGNAKSWFFDLETGLTLQPHSQDKVTGIVGSVMQPKINSLDSHQAVTLRLAHLDRLAKSEHADPTSEDQLDDKPMAAMAKMD